MKKKEKEYLQALACRVKEFSVLPEQEEKRNRWKLHNGLKKVRTPVLLFPEGSWTEIMPDGELVIDDPLFRGIERELKTRIYYAEKIKDDNVIDDILYSQLVIEDTGWGIVENRIRTEDAKGACHFEPVIKEEKDAEKIKMPQVSVDWKASEENFQRVSDIFGGILKVEKQGHLHDWFCIVDSFAVFRGIDNLFLDLVERPEWLHSVFARMTKGINDKFDSLEAQGALSLNNGNQYVGSGGRGYTDELPSAGFNGRVGTIDMWGHATTQIFSLVSPEMHNEFALKYEIQHLSRFGLNCYGCCEPLHHKMKYIKQIPRLRRVSMSPWVDVAKGAEELEDKYIFSYKPNPAVIAAEVWNPERVRAGLKDVLEKTRGCVVEFVMKDIHTCRNRPERLSDWVRIAIEVAEQEW